ncbi:hypothetical protein EXN66_Car006781 [Channa argus]|uniref:Ig-like domain-containing protein n=1 Tax=Channa argus TaxID=215402 RepID=A0A6G1PLJ6_CHAAH|nr:hypothetical protein EXN66_Car006781 [Channa argus]
MEMWLKRSTLMLYTVAVAGMVMSPKYHQTSVILDKTEREVNVPVGSSLALHCNLSKENYKKYRVSWYFDPSGSSFNDSGLLVRKALNQCEKSINNLTDEKMICNLSNVTQQHCGLYFCKVTGEIPVYVCNNSSGTQINILPLPEGSSVISWWMWILLGVFTFILIVLLVICILLRRRPRRSRAPDPIYINTRPMVNKHPSPRPALSADKLKTAPSSRNLRTPSPGRRYE